MAPLDPTMGPLLLGVIVCAVFYGVSLSQVYYYYTRYPRDPLYMKLLVAAVCTTDTIHQGLISHSIYWYLITTYGDVTALSRLSSTIIIEVIFQAFTGLFVQSFFAARIYKLSGKKVWLVVPVVLMIAAEFSVSIAYAARGLQLETFAELVEVKALSLSINIFAAAGDVVIAFILCTILQFSKTGFERSNLLINKLILFSVNTGLLTSICACISLITILALPDTFVYIFFFFMIGRLYANSLMATLNARKGLRDGSSAAPDTSVSLRDLHPSHANTAAFSKRDHNSSAGIAIRIDTHKESRHDAELEYQSTKYGSSDKHIVEAV
ncbi:hypothetical protein L226DRAFT_535433 [Lentinus tigrinus ALCF2SS1-7]|uniref:DUF6534 domain-containing protein n=1 Tax=Lentinus tigrinus ALCF2SS1-6 TaxID=1328759 RepID=A0A5C2SE18_9APHY|nr:hypothetical protein L227DRAFT_609914 [Lentinus tigrinus ALCF2SS1-6]RPD74548.1 hypothetical protein L226DRAFT_535433 [Lentinus tigrinus ALCF2SS1-7]